ncbi:hypothetical protein GCM10017655_15070 [Pseudomonas turukhanskensis]|uniref:Uncharacterized protein n=1 Tax=Pseudomonas turukhanskensis TaxID=1806536 RepID=A0A9W6K680_9PSED|nr:hypothetical protein GCM10017655_15070 [Pseudomonas turukhanskensis]
MPGLLHFLVQLKQPAAAKRAKQQPQQHIPGNHIGHPFPDHDPLEPSGECAICEGDKRCKKAVGNAGAGWL